MAKSDAPAPAAPSKDAPKKRIRVLNTWNQIVSIALSDGTERHIKAKGFLDLDENLVSGLMTKNQIRGTIRFIPVPAEPTPKADAK